jgi:hypothetical protein
VIRTFAIACLLGFMLPECAQGAIVIQVQTSTLNEQGIGFVDVYLTGDAGDTLGAFGYEFTITGANAQSGDLRFRETQSKSEQSEGGTSPYVFLNDTDESLLNSGRGDDAVTLRGGDSLASLDSVQVNGQFLLARLELEHVGSMTVPTHDFTIALNPTSQFTFFDRDWDSDSNVAGISDNYGTFTSLSGIVTVNATAVPEPSCLLLLGTAGAAIYVHRRRKSVVGLQA